MENNNIKELNDEELEKVAGGNLTLHFFDREEDVRFIFWVGDIVYVKETIFNKTKECIVRRREVFKDPQYNCYTDLYVVETTKYPKGSSGYLYTRVQRDDIVNQAK